MPLDKKCWVDYGITLRKRMFQERKFDITISIEEIKSESNTKETLTRLGKQSFWDSIREVKPGWDILFHQGVLTDFDDSAEKISQVTFRLETSRRQHLERIIEAQ